MITADNPLPTERELESAQHRLDAFVRLHLQGKCKIISLGHDCICALCDLDRMRAKIRKGMTNVHIDS